MNDIQRQFLHTRNNAFILPITSRTFGGQPFNVYLAKKRSSSLFIPPQLPPTPTLAEIIVGLGVTAVFVGGIIVVAEVLNTLLSPIRNDEPLTTAMRRYIRERDGEICFYCGDSAPNGHVDHRISRANGGSNEPENLTWACVFCNCSKGLLNDTEFILLLEAS